MPEDHQPSLHGIIACVTAAILLLTAAVSWSQPPLEGTGTAEPAEPAVEGTGSALEEPTWTISPDSPPTYGAVSIEAGWEGGPVSRVVTAGGPARASALQDVSGRPCEAGWIKPAPDLQFDYTAAEEAEDTLVFLVDTAGSDPTLAIRDPEGGWHCNDDWSSLMPRVQLDAPVSGGYDVFVGTFVEGDGPEVTVVVTGDPLHSATY